jgi:hypothetical protein
MRPARVLAIALVALAVAACGSSTSTASPAASAASTAASSPAASTAPAASGAAGSPGASAPASSVPLATADPNATPPPPLTRVPDLEALIPKKIGGKDVVVSSQTGADVMASGSAQSRGFLQAILDATGGQPSDYGFAWTVAGDNVALGVYRVKGADPLTLRDTLIDLAKKEAGGVYVVDSGTIGGQKVEIFRRNVNGQDWSWYYWPKGDVLFFAQATDPAAVEAILSGL